jgi:serine/threonine protein kinase
LLDQAMQLPTGERCPFLDAECGGDAALRREVEWMLEAADAPDDDPFLERGPLVDPVSGAEKIQIATPRDYRLIRPLGTGGMGVVYLAERAEGDYTKKVALKFVDVSSSLLPGVQARFRAERRILAELDHPAIAHLVDGGSLPDGRPFLAMEYIEGETLDEYCTNNGIGIEARLDLFLKVCAAVEFAHQRLVIHRDIKPHNILVTAAGQPKLLDFGIAQLIQDVPALGDSADLPMMTLSYASPEQIAGRHLTVATDVFSLGVLLYELLCGTLPWPERHVDHGGDPPPSPPSVIAATRSGHARAYGRIGADLDAIVLKAIDPHIELRYGSVREFADDLGRYRDGLPVKAQPDVFSYRLNKFARRHRYALTWVLGVLVLLTAALIDRNRQLIETRNALHDENQINRLVMTLFESVDPDHMRQPNSAPQLLSGLLDEIETTQLSDVRRQVSLLARIGELLAKWDNGTESAAVLLRAWQLCESHPDKIEPAVQFSIAMQLSRANGSRHELVQYWQEQALDFARRRIGSESVQAARAESALARQLLGWTHGRWPEIRAMYDHAAKVLTRELDADSLDSLRAQVSYAEAIVQMEGFNAEAEKTLAQIDYRLRGRDDGWLVRWLAQRGEIQVLTSAGRYAEALQVAQGALDSLTRRLGPEHSMVVNAQGHVLEAALYAGNWPLVAASGEELRKAINLLRGNFDHVQQVWHAEHMIHGYSWMPAQHDAMLVVLDELTRRVDIGMLADLPTEAALLRASIARVRLAVGDLDGARSAIQLALASVDAAERRFEFEIVAGESYILAARIALAAGDIDVALVHARTARARSQLSDANAHAIEAIAHWKKRDHKAARAHIEQVLAATPTSCPEPLMLLVSSPLFESPLFERERADARARCTLEP